MSRFPRLARELLAVPPTALLSKARALNRVTVVRGLVDDDGLSADEVEALYVLLARRLHEAGLTAPAGFYPLAAWAHRPLPAGIVVPPPAAGTAEEEDADDDDDGFGDDDED